MLVGPNCKTLAGPNCRILAGTGPMGTGPGAHGLGENQELYQDDVGLNKNVSMTGAQGPLFCFPRLAELNDSIKSL